MIDSTSVIENGYMTWDVTSHLKNLQDELVSFAITVNVVYPNNEELYSFYSHESVIMDNLPYIELRYDVGDSPNLETVIISGGISLMIGGIIALIIMIKWKKKTWTKTLTKFCGSWKRKHTTKDPKWTKIQKWFDENYSRQQLWSNMTFRRLISTIKRQTTRKRNYRING